ncbi:hypothetical protein M9Y10_003950 [Tritrichomonas musculus]|uniref:Uncharacterized protein n=1 Tax=Tritrichomonas musculus TaxID=1915356 RepID=A0ABR2JR60_9EUKA
MENLGKLKKIAIQDEPNNVTAIFADDTSVSNIFPTFLVFVSFFLIILTLGLFAPNESEIINSALTLGPNAEHEDIFNSVITNISSINQKLRVSILYNNATIDDKISHPIRTTVTADFYTSKGDKLDSISSSNSIVFDRPIPLFQTSIINFDKIELKTTIDTKYDRNHTINLKYEFVSAESSFFQLKVRAILSIISFAIFIFLSRTISKTLSQVMTLFLHIASFFVFNPLQIIACYFPSITLLCFDYIFRNVGLAYFYFYINMIFFSFEENLSKFVITVNILMFVVVFILLLSKDFYSLMESYPTIYPLEFNSNNYNVNRFIKKVPGSDSQLNRISDLALKLAFLESTTLNEANLSLREINFLTVLLIVPLFVSITYSIINVQDIFFHRIIVFAITVAAFTFCLLVFWMLDFVDGFFNGKLVGWLVPLASLSTFSLVFTFLNLEDDRDATYEYVMANDENGLGENGLTNENNETLGLEEDDEQIKRNNNEVK